MFRPAHPMVVGFWSVHLCVVCFMLVIWQFDPRYMLDVVRVLHQLSLESRMSVVPSKLVWARSIDHLSVL